LRSFERFEAVDDKRGRTAALIAMGLALEQLGRPEEALARGEEALALGRELGYPLSIRDAAQLLDRLHRASGHWQEALEMNDLHTLMRDSMMNEEARRSTIRQQYKYEYEKKEAGLKAEQRENLT
jgi:tetratricopeptide (TPR) repeat protein